MGLGEFSPDDDDSPTSSGTEYQLITREQFEQFLDELPYEFDEASVPGAGERVYEYGPLLDYNPRYTLRVFSTIDKRTDKSRKKGADAIRTVIWDSKMERPIGGRTKTLRIAPSDSNPQGWKGNLKPKIESIIEEVDEWVVVCDECDGFLVPKDGQYGEFLGCNNYPDCTNTADIEQWEKNQSNMLGN